LAELTLTQLDKGKSVTICPGEIVRISLDENPGTGFRWELEQEDDQILHLLASHFVGSASAGVGGGGHHIWEFMAKKNGNVRLTMKHWRAWEGCKSTIERLDFAIQIKAN
jgi:Predicted secreted protein